MTGVNSGIVKERKRGDNRVASVSAGQNLVGRLGRALDDGDLPMEKNNIWDARTDWPALSPGSPFFTGKSGFGVVGVGFGMARGGRKIGYEPGRFWGL